MNFEVRVACNFQRLVQSGLSGSQSVTSIHNNPSVNHLATGVAYVDGRTGRRGRRRPARTDVRRPAAGAGEGAADAWPTVGGQATIERSEIVACTL